MIKPNMTLKKNILDFSKEYDFSVFVKDGLYNNKVHFCNFIESAGNLNTSGCRFCKYELMCLSIGEESDLLKEIYSLTPELTEYLV